MEHFDFAILIKKHARKPENLTEDQKEKIRDPMRNYLTLFGKPVAKTLSFIVILPWPQRWKKRFHKKSASKQTFMQLMAEQQVRRFYLPKRQLTGQNLHNEHA